MSKTGDRRDRLQAIEDLIAEQLWISTQEEMAQYLREKGFNATQSSISRDLQELGIKRVKGRYVQEPWRQIGAGDFDGVVGFVQHIRRTGPHLAVITTNPNAAKMVANAIDGAGWPEVSGTVAGEDTIFVATASQEDQDALFERLGKYLRP